MDNIFTYLVFVLFNVTINYQG